MGFFRNEGSLKRHDHTNKEPDKRGWIDFKESPKLLCSMQNHTAININEPSKDLRVGCRAMMETKVVRLDKQMFEIYDEKNNAKMIVDAKLLTPMNKSQLKAVIYSSSIRVATSTCLFFCMISLVAKDCSNAFFSF
eukprot:UN02663